MDYFELYLMLARGVQLALDTLQESGSTEKAIGELRISLTFCEMMSDHIEMDRLGETE